MSVRVLVVDDQTLVRAGFRMIIEAQPDMEVVGEASDGAEALALAARTRPHVVLMDIRMPNLDGIEATRRLVATNPVGATGHPAGATGHPADAHDGAAAHVLILTTYDLDEYVYDALVAGASGFLLKDVPPEDLVHAIRQTAAGETLLAPSVTRRLIERFTATGTVAANERRLEDLTAREVEVLRLVARGLSNAEIASTLFLGESTVKTHVGHILEKLGLRDRVQAVIVAYETGVVRPGEDRAS